MSRLPRTGRAGARCLTSIEVAVIEIRQDQVPEPLLRTEFGVRFRATFVEPAFRAEDPSIARLQEIAWQACSAGRNVARAVAKAVVELRSGRLQAVQPNLSRSRRKQALTVRLGGTDS